MQRAAKEATDFHDQLHSMDYLVYAYLQLGQDAKAKAVIDETFPHYVGLYNGKGSIPPQVCDAIEDSDCLLSVGYREAGQR